MSAVAALPGRAGSASTARAIAAPARLGVLARIRAYSYRVPHAVPEWHGHTFAALARAAAVGRIATGPDVARLERDVARRLGAPRAVAVASGRVAIEIALRALGLGDDPAAEVLVPAFCCESVLTPIRAVGARPVLIDVGPDLTPTAATVRAALSPRTRALIVPQLFGNPADMAPILDLCRAHRVAVVDDAAQALGATLDRRPLGMLGDVGLVSFGNGKVCFGAGGGVLVSADPDLLERAAAVSLAAPAVLSSLARVGEVLVWRRWRRRTLPLRVLLARVGAVDGPPAPYARRALANVEAAVARSLLRDLDANLGGRRRRVALYERLLGDAPGVRLIPHRPGSACLAQVVSVERRGDGAVTARDLVDELRARGFEIQASYRPLHLGPAARDAAHGPLPVSEEIWETLLELPCEPSVSEALVSEISEHVLRRVGRPC